MFGSWLSFTDQWYPFHILGTAPQFNDYHESAAKLAVVFSNPAVLKVFCLQCDLFSLAKPYVYNKKAVLQEKDPALDRINNPNPMQSMQDWLWSYMFWKMVGNAYLYMTSKVVDRPNAPMYWLENHKIEFPSSLDKEKDKLILSEAKLKKLMQTPIIYRYEDGTTISDLTLGDLAFAADLTNSTGNWFKGFSRIDALRKVITNSEAALDAKNINVRYAGKFLVSGQVDVKDVTKKLMGEDEKKLIEDQIDNDKKKVHAMKSMVDLKRFVDDLKVMELGKTFLEDYYLVGSMYNIPRDVLEAYQSSTFENQEKARASHVTYTLDPAGDVLGGLLAKAWGYTERGYTICFSWDHLPFTQVFLKEKVNIQQTQVNIMMRLREAGMTIEEINSFLDTDFVMPKTPEENEPAEQ